MSVILRPYQEAAAAEIMKALEQRENIIIQIPTGGGKTEIGLYVIQQIVGQMRRAGFCVPYLTLASQTANRFRRYGLNDLRIWQGSNTAGSEDALAFVASIQTLEARKALPDAEIVFIDECHLQHKHVKKWMAERPETVFIGFSATPWSRGLIGPKSFSRIVKPTSIEELIRDKFLVPPRVFMPSRPNVSRVKISKSNGDYVTTLLGREMSRPEISGRIVANWKLRGEGRKTIAFCVNKEHALYLKGEFESNGILCGYVDKDTKSAEREQIKQAIERGEIQVIISIAALIAGFDAPFVSCVIFARPTTSPMLFVQALGRGLRISPETGKTDCLIFDHAGATARHGFVVDIDREGRTHAGASAGEASQEKQAAQKDRVKICEGVLIDGHKCGSPNTLDAIECDKCGWCFPPPVVEIEAELVEREKPKRPPTLAEMPKHEIYAQLKKYADRRGYKPGWVFHKFKEITGAEPHYSVKARAAEYAGPVCPEIVEFIARKNAEWRASLPPQRELAL